MVGRRVWCPSADKRALPPAGQSTLKSFARFLHSPVSDAISHTFTQTCFAFVPSHCIHSHKNTTDLYSSRTRVSTTRQCVTLMSIRTFTHIHTRTKAHLHRTHTFIHTCTRAHVHHTHTCRRVHHTHIHSHQPEHLNTHTICIHTHTIYTYIMHKHTYHTRVPIHTMPIYTRVHLHTYTI